ncbi:MAG TPA: HlyD family efflux transporter periplasmic adaptor subunit, partial [Parvularculaceae bacterium]|nr:HlyD family efflux transporter periplasmic adaptor subunit [Parvularculaceae bacterium]
DVYMTIFLPAEQAGKLSIGSEARLVFDPLPNVTIPGKVTFVSPQAQFTPKQVETKDERQKLMFRVKVQLPPALLKSNIDKVKTGVRGVAYVRLDDTAEWPERLAVRLPDRAMKELGEQTAAQSD